MALSKENAFLRDVGRKIAELRSLNQRTQEEFSEVIGVSVQYLRRIEAGKENLTLRSMYNLARHLNVSVIELLTQPVNREVKIGRPKKSKGLKQSR